MKKYIMLFLLLPAFAWASISGIDDVNPNIPEDVQKTIDDAITTYYQAPSAAKIDTVLDIMNDTDVLLKKTSWAPLVGFLTVIFENNRQHVFDWMARNDYNQYAQDIFINALMHAKLTEAALVFAQAHQWTPIEQFRIRATSDKLDMKHLNVTVPSHIDTLWGAFFASGDTVYVDEIITTSIDGTTLPHKGGSSRFSKAKEFWANKKLAEETLKQYAPLHKPVRDALKARIASEKDEAQKSIFKQILGITETADSKTAGNSTMVLMAFAALLAAVAGVFMIRRKKHKVHGV